MRYESMLHPLPSTTAWSSPSPSVFNEDNTAIDHFGGLLQKAGYSYYGHETLYSGVDGRELKVQIFFGIVYYQRLRHMIADKYQVRATGPVDPATLQPVKGRKKGGGVRFGEMERDSLIAHGTAFCILDRFLLSSDVDCVKCCIKCGSMLSSSLAMHNVGHAKRKTTMCRMCGSYGFKVASMRVPRVLVYLAAELAAMNINLVTYVSNQC